MQQIVKNPLIFSTAVALLYGVAIAPFQTAQAQARTVTTARYNCDIGGSFRVEYREDHAVLAYGSSDGTELDQIFTLPQVESDDGVRYSDGTYTLFRESDIEDGAYVERNGDRLFDDCAVSLVSSTDYTQETESIIIEEQTRVRFNRPETPTYQEPAPTAATSAPSPSPAPAPAPAPQPVRGLW